MLIITVAGGAYTQVGEVGGEAARAVGCAEGGEGHGVLGVQRGRKRWGELNVSQIGQRTAGVMCDWEHGWVQLLVWRGEYAEKGTFSIRHKNSLCETRL